MYHATHRSNGAPRTVVTALFALLLLTVAGCGFHLRGSISLPAHLSPLYVSGISPHSELGAELERALVASGVTLADDRANPSVALKIHRDEVERRISAVSTGANSKFEEQEYTYTLEFSALRADGNPLLDRQAIIFERELLVDDDNLIGKEDERRRLYEEMRRLAVQQLLMRLKAAR